MLALKIILLLFTICFLALTLLVLLTKDVNCYAILCKDTKPKSNLEKIRYKLWLMCGVSPSGLINYQMDKKFKIFMNGFESGIRETIPPQKDKSKNN